MITAIQNYQNTPRLQTNKPKANNSPSFGTDFKYTLLSSAEETVKYIQRQNEDGKLLGCLPGIRNCFARIAETLKKDRFSEDLATFRIQGINVDDVPSSSIKGNLTVSKNCKDFNVPDILLESKKDSLELDEKPLIEAIESIQVVRPMNIGAGDELLSHRA